MRIDGKAQLGTEQLEYASRSKKTDKKGVNGEKAADARSASGSDAVVISGKAKETVSLARALKEMPEVRNDKVAELKARVADGSYNVSGRDIAEKIVSSALNGLF